MSCPISAKIFYVWTQIPRIFSKTKKQLSFRGLCFNFQKKSFSLQIFSLYVNRHQNLVKCVFRKFISSETQSFCLVTHLTMINWVRASMPPRWNQTLPHRHFSLQFFFFFQKAHCSIDGVPFIQVHQTMSTYKLSRNFLKSVLSYH